MTRLPPLAELSWTPEGAPRATAFDDVYFSRAGGLAEAEAVFLAGCGLPEAWRNKGRFAICELGFGSGLNVLAAWRAWKKTRSPHAILHISTIEAFPLAEADAARALACFPELEPFSQRLLAHWPVRAYAPQRFWCADDGFALTVFTGDAETVLAGIDARFDAWFLDGFSPARNEAMWTPTLFAEIARLSAPGARVATFTVAGAVRRGLESAGFTVAKRPGFGAKRERLEAMERGSSDPLTTPDAAGLKIRVPVKRVAVIGAGIAGAACAAALTRRHVETVVLEAARDLGAGASGNPASLVMPRLDRGGALSVLFLATYLEAIATYASLGEGVFEPSGVEQRPEARNAEAIADLLVDPPLPEDWLRALPGGAALHVRAGLVRPRRAIERLLQGATLLREAPVQRLDASPEGGWTLRAPDGRAMLKADVVVLACGAGLTRFEPAAFLPIEISYGQIEWGRAHVPTRALTAGAYVAPFEDGVLFGATFDRTPVSTEVARARNLAALAKLAPELADTIEAWSLQSRASMRATTPDRAPIAGELPNAEAWLSANAAGPMHDGVYVIGGLGARGLTLAPLLGEQIAAEICGEPPLLPRQTLAAIHPARFLLRALKRR